MPSEEFFRKYRISFSEVSIAVDSAKWILSSVQELSTLMNCSTQLQKSISEVVAKTGEGSSGRASESGQLAWNRSNPCT